MPEKDYEVFSEKIDFGDYMDSIRRMSVKMRKTLDDCRQAVLGRTSHVITREKVLIRTL